MSTPILQTSPPVLPPLSSPTSPSPSPATPTTPPPPPPPPTSNTSSNTPPANTSLTSPSSPTQSTSPPSNTDSSTTGTSTTSPSQSTQGTDTSQSTAPTTPSASDSPSNPASIPPVANSQTSTSAQNTQPPSGSVLTQTSFVFSTSLPTNSSSANNVDQSTSKGFFHNTGAVAGVFSVVGIIVVALIIALVTNGIRRRRARKYDRETEEAAAAAATATAPAFLDDEEDDLYNRGGFGKGGGYGVYSDASSHGTFGQPALSTGHGGPEAYGMREMAHGPNPGEYYDPGYGTAAGTGAAAGAAGIGLARARSAREGGYAAGLQEGSSPYPAFAGPGMPQPRTHNDGYDLAGGPVGGYHGPGNNEFLLDAAGTGVGAGVGAGLARGQSQYNRQYNQQPAEYSNLSRNKSMGVSREGEYGATAVGAPGSISLDHNHSPVQQDAYGSSQPHYQPGPAAASGAGAYSDHNHGDDNMDAYGGYVDDHVHHEAQPIPSPGLPNPFGAAGVARQHEDHGYESSGDEEEPQHGRRVLKVANE